MEIMIIYHQAFDLYHTVYRMLQLLTYFNRNESVEMDRLRIWDFYLLFPDKMNTIKLKQNENDIRKIIKSFVKTKDNPYEKLMDNRKMFEKIKPYQLTALKSLASYGIIDKNFMNTNHVTIISNKLIENYSLKFEPLTNQEQNAIHLLTSHFYQIPMFGADGVKERTNLLESKYDA